MGGGGLYKKITFSKYIFYYDNAHEYSKVPPFILMFTTYLFLLTSFADISPKKTSSSESSCSTDAIICGVSALPRVVSLLLKVFAKLLYWYTITILLMSETRNFVSI